jgi:hypothetical protein
MSYSFPSLSMANADISEQASSSYIRLSPTSFFNTLVLPNTNPSSVSTNQSQTSAQKETSPGPKDLISTPKSHHRRAAKKPTNISAACARKKLCYPENGTPSQKMGHGQITPVTPRTITFVPNFVQAKPASAPAKGMKKNTSAMDQSTMFDNFSSTNVYATPSRHLLRRQQSASATMVSVNGRYVPTNSNGHKGSNTAFVRFTPPIGEDVSTLYAGSKFSDSPSAKYLPMPPSQWLECLVDRASTLAINSDKVTDIGSEIESTLNTQSKQLIEEESDDTGVVFDLDDGKSSPSSDSSSRLVSLDAEFEVVVASRVNETSMKLSKSEGNMPNKNGMRIHPLQLIAAVAAS